MKTEEVIRFEVAEYGAPLAGAAPDEEQRGAKQRADKLIASFYPSGWTEFYEWYGRDGSPCWVVDCDRLNELMYFLRSMGFDASTTVSDAGEPALLISA